MLEHPKHLPPVPYTARQTRQTTRDVVRLLPVLLISTLLVPCSTAAASMIRLTGYTFDPLVGVPTPAGGIESGPSTPDALGVFIVQFNGPLTPAHHALVATAGEVLGYVPDHAYLVRATADDVSNLAANPAVRWAGALQPGFKLSLPLREAVGGSPATSSRDLRLWTVGNPDDVRQQLESVGAVWVDSIAHSVGQRTIIRASGQQLADIARLLSVLWIEGRPEAHFHNETTAWVAQSNVLDLLPIWDQELRGEGQIAIVMDSGVDYDSTGGPGSGPSCHFGPGKILDYQWFASEHYPLGTDTCGFGHGTHVAGTLAGKCVNLVQPPAVANNGIAFEAQLIVQDIGRDGQLSCPEPPEQPFPEGCQGSPNIALIDVPTKLTPAFEAGLALGGTVHSNSWGEEDFSYTELAQDVDEFMWSHPGFLVVFLARPPGRNQTLA